MANRTVLVDEQSPVRTFAAGSDDRFGAAERAAWSWVDVGGTDGAGQAGTAAESWSALDWCSSSKRDRTRQRGSSGMERSPSSRRLTSGLTQIRVPTASFFAGDIRRVKVP